MTQRRPHWTDDLIDTVREAVLQCVDRDSGGVFDDALPDVIAAVEDWQAQHEIVSAPAVLIGAVQRAAIAEAEVERLNRIISESKPWIAMADELADAQAVIQQVRDVLDEWDDLVSSAPWTGGAD